MATPTYSAPHNGILGDATATAGAGQVNQFLGTHGAAVLYQGNSILTPTGTGGTGFSIALDSQDIDQPFTLAGTTVGRVEIPLLAVGDGADLLVSLCADNGSAMPGSVAAQTRIPASWITQLAAVTGVAGPSSAYPQLTATGSPLATARFNPLRYMAGTFTPYAFPAVSATGTAASPASAYYDTGTGTGYLYLIGGVNSGNALASVFSISGDASGTIANAVPQPNLPQLTDGSGKATVAVETDGTATLVIAGGATTFGGTPTGAVYTSAVNTANGNLGAWSAQTALPVNIQNQGIAASGSNLYIVGGISGTGGTLYSSVYYAQVQNSQITAWTALAPFPVPIQLSWLAVVAGYLVCSGGATNVPNTTATSATYYAAINSDGSLGQWVAGPALPVALSNTNGYALQGSAFGTVLSSFPSQSFFTGFTGTGPGATWYTDGLSLGQSSTWYVSTGTGTYALLNVNYFSPSACSFVPISVVPVLSVPLPATGLTNGATYHVVMQQQGGDPTDYLVLWEDANALPTFVVRSSPRGTNAWLRGVAGTTVPLQVFDQTSGGAPLHTWNDNGARVTTLVHATTPDQRLIGVCEATRKSFALNANTGFEDGISPWTVTGGTPAHATTEVRQGQYALQITPSGTDATVVAASEIMPCLPGQWCTATGWVWFTNAVTSNFSMSIAWYTAVSGGTQLSVSSSPVSVPAATYTQETQALQAPTGAYGFQIQATLSGTPPASQIWYLDSARAHPTYTGPQNSTVAEITSTGTWPAPTTPTGVNQLA